jgi:polysaccharide chain length determinant protein (PEP-CTERM system associated)
MNEQLILIYGYLHGMWRYRWSALAIAWVVAIIGWPVVFALPDQYSAKSVIYIDTSSVMKPLLKGLAPETDADDELQVMSRMLLSRRNLLSVIRETDMDHEVGSPEDREKMLADLADDIVFDGGGKGKTWGSKNNIYEISYQSSSADRSYQVVSNLSNTMIEDILNSTRTDTVTAQKFLNTQIAEYEVRLSAAEQQLAEFKKNNVGFMPDEKGGYFARLQRAQDAAELTRSELRLAQRRYTELNRQLKGESPILSSDSYQSASEKMIQQYQQQLDSLLNQYTEQHPDVRATQAIIDDLKASRAANTDEGTSSATGRDNGAEFNPVYQEVKVELSKASVDVATLKIQLSEQETYVTKLKNSIDVIPEVEAKLAKLNRDYEVTHERYLELVKRRESVQLAQSAGQSTGDVTFRIIEPPVVPTKPSGPKRVLLLAGVLLAAMAAGLSWSFLRYSLQPTFIDLRQLGRVTNIPVLGSVSLYLSPEHLNRRRLQLASFLSVALLLLLLFAAVLIFRSSGRVFVGSVLAGI